MHTPAIMALNHLLAQNGWDKTRLARFCGKTAELRIPPFSLTCTIEESGALRLAAADTNADAACDIAPSLLPRLALDQAAFDEIIVSGDAELAEELRFLARHLRWDAAEDLSRIMGDVAAERLVAAARAARRQFAGGITRIAQALAEYWTEEHPLIASPRHLDDFAQAAARLDHETDTLERRIARLESVPK